MILNRIFYNIKPLIPRRVQIYLRRQIAYHKKKKNYYYWPIDGSAGDPPAGWTGWPEGKKFAVVYTTGNEVIPCAFGGTAPKDGCFDVDEIVFFKVIPHPLDDPTSQHECFLHDRTTQVDIAVL